MSGCAKKRLLLLSRAPQSLITLNPPRRLLNIRRIEQQEKSTVSKFQTTSMVVFTSLAMALGGVFSPPTKAVAPSGGFFVHVNQQSNNSDSRQSVTFYDADDLNSGSASPLFSVHVPGEIITFTETQLSYNFEELGAIAADPNTGDVYIISFDSGSTGSVDDGGNIGPDDTDGDLDLYRVNFAAIYDHWSTNFAGTTVTAGVTPGVGGVSPTIPAGAPTGGFDDYITYSSTPQLGAGLDFDPDRQAHSNTFTLANSIEKIGEVQRNTTGQGFYDYSLEFINGSTLVMIDDSSASDANETAATDHAYRLLERVSTSPGAAVAAGTDDGDGGFNSGTTESWQSRVIGRVNLDFADGLPAGHSEPESMAYHEDILSGARGFWVTESDGGGDDIAFFDIDLQAYREHAVGGGPDFPDSFALDNDPAVNSASNDGQADHIFVDSDTGDIIIVESGFGDSGRPGIGADHEPAVIRREILSYDDGNGRIQFGAWSQKVITNPTKDGGTDVNFLERGAYSAYDSENDLVYFINPGGGGDTPMPFGADIMVLDINTGVTTTLLNVDESVSIFFPAFGDFTDFFFLPEIAEGLAGDFNDDGVVDAIDYALWRDNLGSGDDSVLNGNGDEVAGVGSGDFDVWLANYGASAPGGVDVAGAPEPAASLLAFVALSGLAVRSRRG